MFKRNAKNNSAEIVEIPDAEANIIASRKLKFWLKRIACAVVQTKAMCIINRSTKLMEIQHEKKYGKGSNNENRSIYFDNNSMMIEEEETEKVLDDVRYSECAYIKDDDNLCAKTFLMLNVLPVLHLLQF